MRTGSINRLWMFTFAAIFTLSLAACGGSSGGGSSDNSADTGSSGSGTNSPPTANAGVDQTTDTGSQVTLDGSGSSDPDGDPLNFSWSVARQPSGGTAALSDETASQPTFTPNLDGDYEFTLVVSDGSADSSGDSVSVTASTTNTNNAPTADAGTDQSVKNLQTATLDGSGSSDPDSDALTYQWSITSKPGGSTATLSGNTTNAPSLTTDKKGDYKISLVVNDGTVNSATDEVIVTATNNPPVADAGDDQNVSLSSSESSIMKNSFSPNEIIAPVSFDPEPVTLDGSGSSDPDEEDNLTYHWTLQLPDGINCSPSLDDETLVSPSFNVCDIGTYTLTLTVNDGSDSSSDTVYITGTAPVQR